MNPTLAEAQAIQYNLEHNIELTSAQCSQCQTICTTEGASSGFVSGLTLASWPWVDGVVTAILQYLIAYIKSINPGLG
jgi:hypothetical protein